MKTSLRTVLFVSASLIAVATPAHAQDTGAAPAAEADGEDIVVTGVARGTNRLDASISTTSLDAEAIADSAPRSAAELLRGIPGIRAESSGGEGNANINVRGIPVSTGGAKFLQLQEDGLPILEFGDIIFGNADIFTRLDTSIERVESVRGGSASTFTSNAPGGIVNFITRDGRNAGGVFQFSTGLDYEEHRVDFGYGGALGDSTHFYLGGFYRIGEGPRTAGYDGNRGGQIRASITQDIGSEGYLRVSLRHLNDRAIAYLPSPVQVTGTNASPDYNAIPGLSPQGDTIHSPNFRQVLTLGSNNTPVTNDIADGMHPVVTAVGAELSLPVGDSVTLSNRFRFADISGRFISPFPTDGIGAAQTVANNIGGAGSTLFFATGPNAGQQITTPTTLGGNGLLLPVVLFNTQLDSLDNVTNDLRLSFESEVGGGTLSLTGGVYYSRQDIATTWTWTSHLLTVEGDSAQLVDVRNAAGIPQTTRGTIAYGASLFGNCCRRQYDLEYTTLAPFASLGFEIGALSFDASIRLDNGDVGGVVRADGPVVPTDVDGNGTIDAAESRTTVLNLSGGQTVDYDYSYTSYSVGATYRLADTASVFARHSRGARANADRLIFGPAISAAGGIADQSAVVDFVNQTEVGFKYRDGPVQLYLTGFYSRTEETNFDFGLGFFSNRYRALGVEAEGSIRFGVFELSGTATYTDAEITAASASPALVGNRPRRQAGFVYQITPAIRTDMFSIGASIVGTTDSYAQDNNQLILPGFTQVNAFASLNVADNASIFLNANNLFDVAGFTEAEEGSIPGNGVVRARSINGRTVQAGVRFNF